MQWKENPQKFKKSGESIMAALAQAALIGKGNQVPSASECGNLCFKQLRRSYEPKLGGFSEAPKFPQPVNMNFLLRWHVLNKGSDADLALDMCAHTLHMMAKGGIFDHVSLVRKSIILSVDVLFHTYIYIFFLPNGQGFARYSTDEKWHVPHFEKMLYDQAQLASVYTDAYLLTKDGDFARIVSDILSYVSNDLSDPSGGFYRYMVYSFFCFFSPLVTHAYNINNINIHIDHVSLAKFPAQKMLIPIRKPDQRKNVKEPSACGLTKKFSLFWALNPFLLNSARVSQCPTLFAITLTFDPTATWIPIRSVYLIHSR